MKKMTMTDILKYRRDLFQGLIQEKNLAALLFVFPNRDGFDLYFTGKSAKTVAPYDHPLQSMDTCVLLKKDDKPTIIHASYLTGPGEPDPLLTHAGPEKMDEEDYRWCLNQKAELYLDALKDNKRLGVINLPDLREELYQFILKYVPDTVFVDVTKEAHCLKAKKCAGDLTEEKESVRRLEAIFHGTYAFIHPAKLERDIANNILAAGEKIAHFGMIYRDWVSIDLTSAPDGADAVLSPLPYPGRMVQMGDRINLCILAALNNSYSAGLGRCFVLGEPCEETRKYWSLTVKAQDAAASAIRPGATIREAVQRAVEDVYIPNAIPYTPSNWIYGLGLNFAMAEFPMAIPEWEDMPLEKDMIICIAPKVELPGKDPFCCMDTYVVTDSGCERLTKTSRDIIDLFHFDEIPV